MGNLEIAIKYLKEKQDECAYKNMNHFKLFKEDQESCKNAIDILEKYVRGELVDTCERQLTIPAVSGSLPLVECEKIEHAAFVAGYKYMRELSEEMKKYPFDEAARITANEEYYRWRKDNDR